MKYYIEKILGSPAKIRVLSTLYNWHHSDLTERQIAGITGLSTFAVRYALGDLAHLFVVTKKSIGKANIWQINPHHYLCKDIKRILKAFLLTQDPITFAAKGLIKLSKKFGSSIEKTYIFGSSTNQEISNPSDIDIAVIMKGHDPRIKKTISDGFDRLMGQFLPKVGKRIETHVFDSLEWNNISHRTLGKAILEGKELFPNAQI